MKKKILFIFLSCFMISCLLMFSACDFLQSGNTAGLYQDGKCVNTWSQLKKSYPDAFDNKKITGPNNGPSYFIQLSGDFVISDRITEIGINTFHACEDLTSIEIPDSVIIIGERAFFGCSGLTSINIPNSVTSIGKQAF